MGPGVADAEDNVGGPDASCVVFGAGLGADAHAAASSPPTIIVASRLGEMRILGPSDGLSVETGDGAICYFDLDAALTRMLAKVGGDTLGDRCQPVAVFGEASPNRVEVAVADQPADRPDLARSDRPVIDLDDR